MTFFWQNPSASLSANQRRRRGRFHVDAYGAAARDWTAPYDPTDLHLDARTRREAFDLANEVMADPSIYRRRKTIIVSSPRGTQLAVFVPVEGGNWVAKTFNSTAR